MMMMMMKIMIMHILFKHKNYFIYCLWMIHSKIIKWKYHNNKLMLEKEERKKKLSIYSYRYLSTRQIWSKYSKKVTYLNLGGRGICSSVISFYLFLIYLKYFIKNSENWNKISQDVNSNTLWLWDSECSLFLK